MRKSMYGVRCDILPDLFKIFEQFVVISPKKMPLPINGAQKYSVQRRNTQNISGVFDIIMPSSPPSLPSSQGLFRGKHFCKQHCSGLPQQEAQSADSWRDGSWFAQGMLRGALLRRPDRAWRSLLTCSHPFSMLGSAGTGFFSVKRHHRRGISARRDGVLVACTLWDLLLAPPKRRGQNSGKSQHVTLWGQGPPQWRPYFIRSNTLLGKHVIHINTHFTLYSHYTRKSQNLNWGNITLWLINIA